MLRKGGAYGNDFWLLLCSEFAQARGSDCRDYVGNVNCLGGVAQADPLDLESLRIDFAEQSAKDEQGAIPNYESTMLPSNGESVVIDTDSIQINNYANNLYGQDDGVLIRLFEYEGDWDSSNVSLVLKGEHASENQFDVTIQNEATYTYSVEFFAAAQGTYLTSFDLKQIKLLGRGIGRVGARFASWRILCRSRKNKK